MLLLHLPFLLYGVVKIIFIFWLLLLLLVLNRRAGSASSLVPRMNIISAEEYTGGTSNNRVYCRAELMQVQPNNNKEEDEDTPRVV